MKTISSVSWVFLAMPLIIESQNVVYLKALEGESVLFTCGSEETSTLPKGLYLKRKCVGPESEVMFFSEFGVKAGSHEDGRIQVHGNLSANLVNITLSELQHRDSGLYYCEFVDAGSPTFRFIQGKEEFFLFVETRKNQKDLQCSCPDYPPVLYAISAAVGLLLLIILGLVASHCGKPCGRNKPHTLVPIYEEMIGRQPSNGKRPTLSPGFFRPGRGRYRSVHQPANETAAGEPLRKPRGIMTYLGNQYHHMSGQPMSTSEWSISASLMPQQSSRPQC